MSSSLYVCIHRLIKCMAEAMLKVFIPILIYRSTGSMLFAFLFIVLKHLFTSILYIAFKKIIQKYPISAILFHIIPTILEFALISLTGNLTLLFIVFISILDAISTVLYYGGSNTAFTSLDKNSNFAKLEASGTLGKMIFVLASAYVLGEFSSSIVFIFIVSSILYITSIIPLIKCKKLMKINYDNHEEISIVTISKNTKAYNIYYQCIGMVSSFIEYILPLYLYIKGYSFTLVGVLFVLTYILKIIGNYIGSLVVKYRFIKSSTMINSIIIAIVSACLFVVQNNLIIYILTLILSFSYQILFVSILSIYLNEQKQKGDFYNALIVRDFNQNFGRALQSVTYFAFFSFIPIFIISFLSGIGIGISGLIATKNYNNINKNQDAQKLDTPKGLEKQ